MPSSPRKGAFPVRRSGVFVPSTRSRAAPLVEDQQNAAITGPVTSRRADNCLYSLDRTSHDPDPFRRHPAAGKAPPLERHRPRTHRRLRRARGGVSPGGGHPGGWPRRPHHAPDARRHADWPCPRPRPRVRRRRTVHPARPRRAADLQRRPQRPGHPRQPVGGLHHRVPARRSSGRLAGRRRYPPHGKVPCRAAVCRPRWPPALCWSTGWASPA